MWLILKKLGNCEFSHIEEDINKTLKKTLIENFIFE